MPSLVPSTPFSNPNLYSPSLRRILVIRLGALGDLVFCFRAFHEIRIAHPNAEITLLVRPAFADFARKLPWFDRIIIDSHPKNPVAWMKLRREIIDFAPDRVYDFQGKMRQTILYALLGGPYGPEWSGAAPFCKFPRPTPKPDRSFSDFLLAQLRAVGIKQAPTADLVWLTANVDRFALPENFVLLIPGCSPKASHKRWGAENYAELSRKLRAQGFASVMIGTTSDAAVTTAIKNADSEIMDLCGKTSLFELAGVMRRAQAVIGNDTGPVHLAAALGVPTLALFSGSSNAIWSKPPGTYVSVLQKENLDDLNADEVFAAFDILLQHAKSAGRKRKSRP